MYDELVYTIVDTYIKKVRPIIDPEDEHLFLKDITRTMLSKPLSDMPLFLNTESNFLQYVSRYRLEHNI